MLSATCVHPGTLLSACWYFYLASFSLTPFCISMGAPGSKLQTPSKPVEVPPVMSSHWLHILTRERGSWTTASYSCSGNVKYALNLKTSYECKIAQISQNGTHFFVFRFIGLFVFLSNHIWVAKKNFFAKLGILSQPA